MASYKANTIHNPQGKHGSSYYCYYNFSWPSSFYCEQRRVFAQCSGNNSASTAEAVVSSQLILFCPAFFYPTRQFSRFHTQFSYCFPECTLSSIAGSHRVHPLVSWDIELILRTLILDKNIESLSPSIGILSHWIGIFLKMKTFFMSQDPLDRVI